MAAVQALVVCPICGQCIYEHPHRAVALAHCDRLGRLCPFSGEPFGAIAPGATT
jgi:hypothetical protein